MRRRRASLESLEDRRVLASYVVVTAGDGQFGTCTAMSCSLREAVEAANTSVGEDTITFAAGITGTIGLSTTSGALTITDAVTISGPGASTLAVDAQATYYDQLRVFDIGSTAGNVTISGLTITGGNVEFNAGGGIRFQSDGVLTIQDSVITGNVANNGGGIYSEYNGSLVITDSEISNNDAVYSSGGGVSNLDGSTTVTGSTVSGNTSYGDGAGIFSPSESTLSITNSTVSDNTVTQEGYLGGGIFSGAGDVTISGSSITGNTSGSDGGGLYSYDGDITINNSNIEQNNATDGGGGLFKDAGSLTITNSSIFGNSALFNDGGGIVSLSGAVTITGSDVSSNIAGGSGGGLAISIGSAVVRDSTFALNSAAADGGGLMSSNAPVTLTNTTISTNDAAGSGGGVHSFDAPIELINSTVVSNFANGAGGGIGFGADEAGESLVMLNTIVAENLATINDDLTAPGGGMVNLSVNHSLIGNNLGTGLVAAPTADANGNLIGTDLAPIDPMLESLTDNPAKGSRVGATHLPMAGSLVIDAAVSVGTPPLDQRGFPRPAFAELDMGAVEFGSSDNDPPTALSLPLTTIDENQDTTAGDVLLGSFTVADSSPVDSHTFFLAPGLGDDDNGSFVIVGGQLAVMQGATIDAETKSSYSIRVRVSDSTDLSFTRIFTFDVNNLPEIVSVQVNGDNNIAQRSQITSLVVQFDTVVDPADLDNAFVITNIDETQNVVTVGNIAVSTDETGGFTTATLTFGGASTVARVGVGVLGNSLADGNYRFDVIASQVRDMVTDYAMAVDYLFGGQTRADIPNDKFFRLYGDADGDGDTDSRDLTQAFAPNYFTTLVTTPGFLSELDGNGDGDIDSNDLSQYFAPNYFNVRL